MREGDLGLEVLMSMLRVLIFVNISCVDNKLFQLDTIKVFQNHRLVKFLKENIAKTRLDSGHYCIDLLFVLKNIDLLMKLLIAGLSAHFFFADEQKRMEQLMNNPVGSLNSTSNDRIMERKVVVDPQLKKTFIFLASFLYTTRIEKGEDPVSDDRGTFLILFPPDSFGLIGIPRHYFHLRRSIIGH